MRNGMETNSMNLSALNCLIDLHVHLDGSLSLYTVRKLAKMQNIILPSEDNQLLRKLQVPDQCQDLNEYLTKFEFPLSLLQTKEALTECVTCLLMEQKEQGLIYSEIRFAPQLHLQKGLSQAEVIKAVLAGKEKACKSLNIQCGIILCCMRGERNQKANQETVRLAAEYQMQGVCGVDLAGAEGLYPTSAYAELFSYAKELNLKFTIHAGEAAGADSVKQAVLYGASRIGHGVRCLEDPEVVRLVKEHNVTLELCPTSNLNTKVFDRIESYPIRQLLESGIRITINTDNMMVSNTNLRHELSRIQNSFMLDDETMTKLLYNAADAAFTTDKVKSDLKEKIRKNTESTKY